MKRLPLFLAALLLAAPAFAADPAYSWKDSAGNTLTLTVKPPAPVAPTIASDIDKLLDGAIYTLPAGTTRSNGWIRVAGPKGVTIAGAAGGSILDCQDALAGGRSCLTNIVSTVPNTVTVRDLTVIGGFSPAAVASDGTGCLRFYGVETTVNITNVNLAYCSDGLHGGAKIWNLKNVRMTTAGNRLDGLSHGIYINTSNADVCESMTIEDSYFETGLVEGKYPVPTAKAFGSVVGNGHQVKSGCKLTTIRNTTLVDGGAVNSGAAINALIGGDVYLENVKIIARKTAGNKSILSSGAVCTYGQGKWTFKNVEIVDEGGNGNVNWLCGKPEIVLEGTNVFPAYMTVAGKPNMILAGPALPK